MPFEECNPDCPKEPQRRASDKILADVLSEVRFVRTKVEKIDSKQDVIESELSHVKEQTTKTNGRVSVVEVKVASLELTRAEKKGEEKAGEKAEQRFSSFVFTPTTTLLIAVLAGVAVYAFTGHK